jgi:3-phosphoinositide dependent protein kinase-1
MHGIHRATGKEYAIKILDKGHLARHNKLPTAMIEKNTLLKIGAGHPGFVKLHWTFHDEYSLCGFILFSSVALVNFISKILSWI